MIVGSAHSARTASRAPTVRTEQGEAKMTGVKHLSMAGPTEAELQSAGLRFTQSGPIAEITLCRPERRNTQSPAMWRALAALGQTMPTDIRVVIVRAEGRSFSAGLDRSMLKDPASPHEAADGETISGLLDGTDMTVARTIREYQDGFLFLRNSNFISIAAVQGHAVGAGFQLALACDLRVVADDATFCMKEVALGLVPDLTG
ncbi:enoyl-CoA hydratase/isomerase family protein [Rhodococcus sp. MSC1_016]